MALTCCRIGVCPRGRPPPSALGWCGSNGVLVSGNSPGGIRCALGRSGARSQPGRLPGRAGVSLQPVGSRVEPPLSAELPSRRHQRRTVGVLGIPSLCLHSPRRGRRADSSVSGASPARDCGSLQAGLGEPNGPPARYGGEGSGNPGVASTGGLCGLLTVGHLSVLRFQGVRQVRVPSSRGRAVPVGLLLERVCHSPGMHALRRVFPGACGGPCSGKSSGGNMDDPTGRGGYACRIPPLGSGAFVATPSTISLLCLPPPPPACAGGTVAAAGPPP